MQTNTPIDDAETTKCPWWLLLSFGIALFLFGGIAIFLGNMMNAGLKYLADDFEVMGEDFWTGIVLVAVSSLLFLTLAAVVVSEMRTVVRKSVAAAKHQARLWRQARRAVVACTGLFVLLNFVCTVIPGRSLTPDFVLIGVFMTLCYLSFTHAKWALLLQRYEQGVQKSSKFDV